MKKDSAMDFVDLSLEVCFFAFGRRDNLCFDFAAQDSLLFVNRLGRACLPTALTRL